MILHTTTETRPRQARLFLHIANTETEATVAHQSENARQFARRFREELDWIEEQDSGAFSAFRTSALEHSATWDVRPT